MSDDENKSQSDQASIKPESSIEGAEVELNNYETQLTLASRKSPEKRPSNLNVRTEGNLENYASIGNLHSIEGKHAIVETEGVSDIQCDVEFQAVVEEEPPNHPKTPTGIFN